MSAQHAPLVATLPPRCREQSALAVDAAHLEKERVQDLTHTAPSRQLESDFSRIFDLTLMTTQGMDDGGPQRAGAGSLHEHVDQIPPARTVVRC